MSKKLLLPFLTLPYNTIQLDTIQLSTTQYNSIQLNTIQYSTSSVPYRTRPSYPFSHRPTPNFQLSATRSATTIHFTTATAYLESIRLVLDKAYRQRLHLSFLYLVSHPSNPRHQIESISYLVPYLGLKRERPKKPQETRRPDTDPRSINHASSQTPSHLSAISDRRQ